MEEVAEKLKELGFGFNGESYIHNDGAMEINMEYFFVSAYVDPYNMVVPFTDVKLMGKAIGFFVQDDEVLRIEL